MPQRLRVRQYQAIDLIALLDALGPARVGRGEWLEIENARGEWASFDMPTLRRLAPRIVVGVDGEENLFRATDLYHTLRRYSWTDAEAERIDMARPLGAFLFFPREDPSLEEGSGHFGRYALTVDSFRRRSTDPLAPLSDLPSDLRSTLMASPDCLACHRFRGVGGRAHHIRAADAAPIGGHGLPLERYPAIVWKRFIFDQAKVAQEVGASPIVFEDEVGRALYELIVAEREDRGIEPWNHPERDRPAGIGYFARPEPDSQ